MTEAFQKMMLKAIDYEKLKTMPGVACLPDGSLTREGKGEQLKLLLGDNVGFEARKGKNCLIVIYAEDEQGLKVQVVPHIRNDEQDPHFEMKCNAVLADLDVDAGYAQHIAVGDLGSKLATFRQILHRFFSGSKVQIGTF